MSVPAALADLQRRVLDIAGGQAAQVAGNKVDPAQYFSALRFTAALARRAASHDDLADNPLLPPTAAEEFADDQYVRQQKKRGGADVQLSRCPLSAPQAAAVLALADQVPSTPDARSCRAALAPWMERAAVLRRAEHKPEPLRLVTLPPCLEPLVRAAAPRKSRVAGALAARAAFPTRMTARHLPQLVDETDYTQVLATHLPGTAPLTGRRVGALALARIAGATSWQEAAADLGMDPREGERSANVVVQRINDPDAFWQAVEELAFRAEQRGLVDYAARRRSLAGLTAVPYVVLFPVCRQVGRDVTFQRRRNAAAWVWQHLTGGDGYEAPAYAPELWPGTSTKSVRAGWRRFAAWIPDPVAQQLVDFGRSLLDGEASRTS
ncbi:hypothetical protein [Streptomyces sp. NBC_00038]|uniref:hypothetical protein n=1 Tax=Streptomyces sp. NBC_00038 TaxID=2903615 RepID=UPI00225ABD9E|nr:hypothetical protein [Streptomyces sp. NBC_00038]MCX5559531.1 hypothetical protein [Streptomyces sp. NBC_00038]